ncbi:MAG: hypothetical protein WBN06_15455, partial [Lysobacterales bacterium]
MRYLTSGLASHIPVALGRDIHVAHGPEVRYRTPSAMCEIMEHWSLKDELRVAEAGVVELPTRTVRGRQGETG